MLLGSDVHIPAIVPVNMIGCLGPRKQVSKLARQHPATPLSKQWHHQAREAMILVDSFACRTSVASHYLAGRAPTGKVLPTTHGSNF